jgi:hypothetical protein
MHRVNPDIHIALRNLMARSGRLARQTHWKQGRKSNLRGAAGISEPRIENAVLSRVMREKRCMDKTESGPHKRDEVVTHARQ